jgi:hypothetical protein
VSGQKHANKPIPTVRDREIKREETGKAKETKGEGGGGGGGASACTCVSVQAR